MSITSATLPDACLPEEPRRRRSSHTEPWWMPVVLLYALCVPLLTMHLPGVGGVGAADFLMPLGFGSLLLLRRAAPIQLSHLALAAFLLAALLSLLMISETRIALHCTIRWLRLTSIVVTFFFGLLMPASGRQINRMLVTYGVGGGLAILIGILLYELQIEIRDQQQKLWMDGGFQIRAGGLIGNSGAFGHLTATWGVTCVGALCILNQSRYRFLLVTAALMVSAYSVYIASSRAAMFHLVVGLTALALLIRMPLAWRKQALTFAVMGGLALALLSCLSQLTTRPHAEASNPVMANLERFIPGLNGGDINEFTSNRVNNWPEYIAMMSDSWLLGTGYKTGVRMHEDSPDNSYLSVMLETGVLGFACMSFFVVSVLYRLLTLYLAGDQYAAVMIPVCVGQLAHCVTSDIYTFWITMPVVYLLLGFVIQREPQRRAASCG